jgi:hypothetical protein
VIGQSIKGCEGKNGMRLTANCALVVLSQEIDRQGSHNLKRSAAWNFFGLKESHKVVLNWPYSAHVSLPTMTTTSNDNYIES